ncbi:MAG: GNAT family N-acetyltransferase [Bacteroidota bacterium]
MKNLSNLAQQNIDNLTSLWQTVGERANAHISGADFDFSIVSNSEWPNRLWFHSDIDAVGISKAKKIIQVKNTPLIVPYWDIYQNQSYELLETNGFENVSEQIGMGLAFDQTYKESSILQIEKVYEDEQALLWGNLFKEAFGYKISHNLLLPNYEHIDFFLVFHEEEPVGTIILHNTNNTVIGIHAMGIIPSMRRKGFAEQLMKQMLNLSMAKGFKYAVLQASSMGKGLYQKLGFQEQFIMKNYSLKR